MLCRTFYKKGIENGKKNRIRGLLSVSYTHLAGVVDDTYLREGQVVIDVGINVNEEGKLCGDVDFEKAEPIVEAITPVPGGVGSVTTSVLVGHVVEAAKIKFA